MLPQLLVLSFLHLISCLALKQLWLRSSLLERFAKLIHLRVHAIRVCDSPLKLLFLSIDEHSRLVASLLSLARIFSIELVLRGYVGHR